MKQFLYQYRFEFLLFALTMVIFNRIFVFDTTFYSQFIWPANMLLLGIVSMGIFHEKQKWIIGIKNILFLGVVMVPFMASEIFFSPVFAPAALITYLLFNTLIFVEVMRQLIKPKEITASVMFGSLCGFLLLILISTFSYLLLNQVDTQSFHNVTEGFVPELYQQMTYFSTVTLTTIGYGDITPLSDNARLLAGFWGVISQFYMVAVVGIIISKFTSK